MRKNMRRMDRAIPEPEARDILHNAEYGILSTLSVDGQPYGVPLSFSYTGDAIYFHCALEGQKLENMKAHARVSFCVVGKTEVMPDKFGTRYESVIVQGTAAEVFGDEKQRGLLELLKKYSAGFIQEGLHYIDNVSGKARVYKIIVTSMTGKARK